MATIGCSTRANECVMQAGRLLVFIREVGKGWLAGLPQTMSSA
jgi:hypothetical protein